jgi:AraC-like DNA-binding protein/uncharacterized membrane protein
MAELTLYQISISMLLVGWLTVLVLVWVRYDRLPHNKWLLAATLFWPLVLMDEWLKLSATHDSLASLIGTMQFVPAIIAALLLLSIRTITVKHQANNRMWFFLPAVIMIVVQLPMMILATEIKVDLLYAPAAGELLVNWPYLAPYLLSAFVILGFAVQSAEYLSRYHFYLSDQVVDIDMYRLRSLSNAIYTLILIAAINILIITLVVFDLQPFLQWQLVLNMMNAGFMLVIMLLLLEKRSYSPTPFDEADLEKGTFSEDQLRYALKQAEQVIIEYKAYKRKGLKITHICDVANISPAALALATRFVLKRNFRAFIYHYRLEYAKKVLMRTDQKVTHVAKRLGFNSEKYLSNVFIKYIHLMSKKPADKSSHP